MFMQILYIGCCFVELGELFKWAAYSFPCLSTNESNDVLTTDVLMKVMMYWCTNESNDVLMY